MARMLKRYLYEEMLECVRPHTNAPDAFIAWSLFSVIGGVMKRKFYINEGLYTIYPNQYIVLVAPPGIGKGTAINFVWKTVRNTAPNYIANMIPDRVTGPRILDRIAAGWGSAPSIVGGQILQKAMDHSCTIFSTELSMLLGASDQMLDYLCELWDRNEYDYDTKNSGSAFIKDTCVSMIAGTVPDFIRNIDRNKNMTIKGGFTSRCLFVFEERPSRFILHPPHISTNKGSSQLLTEIENDVRHIAALPGGEFQYDATAKILYDDYLTKLFSSSKDDSEATLNFKARINVHILKLSMVLALCRADTLVINASDMRASIFFVDKSIKTLEKVFRGTGDSSYAMATGYVQSYLERVGSASRRDILRNLYRHVDADTLDRILYVMVEIGYCTRKTNGNIVMYAPVNPSGVKGVGKP